MGSLSQAKTLGGIGAILTLLGLAPFYTGTALEIIGWILIIVAIKYVSDSVQDKSIFNNALIAAVLAIVGAALGAFVISVGFGSLIAGNFSAIGSFFAGLAVLWILGVVSAIFLWMSFKEISMKLNVSLFRTAGIIYLIGVILTIILVGFLVAFIAQILFVAAFFSIRENVPQTIGSSPAVP